MKLLPKIFRQKSKQNYPPSHDYWYRSFQMPTAAGVEVDEYTALNFSAVFNAITIISGDIGSLPCFLYRKNGKSREVQTGLKANDIIHSQPNPEMTAMNFREASAAHAVSWGNSFAEKVYTKSGQLDELWPIPPSRVKVDRQNGNIYYDVKVDGGREIRMGRESILHIPGLGFDGLLGYSVLSLARESIAMGMSVEQFGARFFGSGTHPGIVVEHPNKLGQEAYDSLKKSLVSAYSGLGKSHRMLLLEEGAKVSPISIPPNDSQFLETRQFQIPEIARWFNIEPSKLKDHTRSTFNNIEHLSIGHVTDCIRPWLVRFEQSYNMQLLTEKQRKAGFYFEHNIEGLLRGDSKSRGEYFTKMFNIGAMSINEIREKENMNPIDGGEAHFVPLNMVNLEQASQPLKPVQIGPAGSQEDEEGRKLLLAPNRPLLLPNFRSVKDRDAVGRQYMPLFLDAADTLIKNETNRLKVLIERNLKDKSIEYAREFRNEQLLARIKEMYFNSFNAIIRKKMLPLILSYGEAIGNEAFREIGLEPELTADLERLLREYTDTYVARHVGRSLGQLEALLKEDEGEVLAEDRLLEWRDKRADKIALEEITRGSGFTSSMVFFGAGFASVWKIRGPETCPYCRELSNRSIRRGQYFIDKGSKLKPSADNDEMLVRFNIANPPLHSGCDCYIGPGV